MSYTEVNDMRKEQITMQMSLENDLRKKQIVMIPSNPEIWGREKITLSCFIFLTRKFMTRKNFNLSC